MKNPFYRHLPFAAAVLLGLGALAAPLSAQTSAESERIALMTAALRARNDGNITEAKALLEDLLRLEPDNQSVQAMLMSVNQDIERRMANQTPVFGRAPASTLPARPGSVPAGADLDAIMAEASGQVQEGLEIARTALRDARLLMGAGRLTEADARLAQAQEAVPVNATTATTMNEIRDLRGEIFLMSGYQSLNRGDFNGAKARLDAYVERFGETAQGAAFAAELADANRDPRRQDPAVLSPDFAARAAVIDRMLVQARSRILILDYQGALDTLRQVEARDAENAEAKALQLQVLELLDRTAYLDHKKTREGLLREVSRQWQLPQVFDRDSATGPVVQGTEIRERLRNIRVPRVEFSDAPLNRVVATLSELTVNQADPNDTGINIVMGSNQDAEVPVTIGLRGATMEEILNLVTQYVGWTWDVRGNFVVVESQGGESGAPFLETEFFAVSSGAVIRMTGNTGGGSGGGSAAPANPFGNPFAAPVATPAGGSQSDTEEKLQNFFQRAGIDFANTPGASLAFDGTQIIVTQTPRNIERMRTVLRNYDETNQVEIEAKFLEVQQGALDQLGFNWTVQTEDFAANASGGSASGARGTSANRTLNDAFSRAVEFNTTTIQQPGFFPISVQNPVPSLVGAVELGQDTGNQFSTQGILGGVEVGLVINALSRSQGSDLLSSPRITVLSGRTAEIVVAQELLYPESYSDGQVEAGSGGDDGAAGGIGVTPALPQDFRVRNVGVEMSVTPTVEQNGNISLELEPQVTEFEGFIEYGAQTIAISGGGTTVTTPSGILQPIFSTRRVRTNVTIFDGATVVLGGLVREQVVSVKDKVPVLGDVPFLGRLFRSEGESYQKRNLMIFVTANLISPGGSTSRQTFRGSNANALFQNPVVLTPGGSVARESAGGGE